MTKSDEKKKSVSEGEQKTIPINGFKQILDMLKIADPAFRDSLLKRLAQRDQQLASSLKRDLGLSK